MFEFMSRSIDKDDVKKQADIEYVTLTPEDNITNGEEYLKALKWAITEKKATNIALSGPYGSGKSSVIETFLKNNPSFEKRSIKISMATFVEEVLNDGGNLEQQRIKIEKDEIERGILKQLFYKVNHKKIPQSRYRKLHKISFWRILLVIFLFVLAISIIGYVFWPSVLNMMVSKIVVAGATIKFPKWLSLIVAILFVFGCLVGISALYQTILSKYKVKEIKLPKDISIQNAAENKDTVFNKNMDEIVYFFEETKYNIVFFEDFDRLNNTSIFVHLRELNIILNNYDAIKKPIVFIYAVKDDIFTDVDRTKFFDFIIPIVPIINSTNSGEILLQKLEKSKQIGSEHDISEGFVMDVSPFISDMRILQNIYNEFVVYKTTLKTAQDLTLLDEPMLALMIFKNLYPHDFAALQKEAGIVKQAFKDKEVFVSAKRKELQKRIDDSTELLEKVQIELINTRKSLKYVFLCEITGDNGIASSFTPSGKGSISTSNFLNDTYAIPDWSNIDSCLVSFIKWNGVNEYNSRCYNFSESYAKLIQNYEAVSLIEEGKIDEEKALVEDLQRQIYELSSKTLSELIGSYGMKEILSADVKSNDLLVFLLRRGYIDEKYVDYINYFKATSITTDDMNYILGVKNLSSKSFDYKLTRTDLVIKRLQPYEFEQEVVYNFDLLEHLLSSTEYNEKLNLYIRQLSNGSNNSWKFIDEFVEITSQKQRFINMLSKNWSEMWDSIYNSSVLTLKRKFYYLYLLTSYSSIDSIKSMDTNGNLTAFFVDNTNVLQQLSSVDEQKIIDIITSLDIKFVDLCIDNISVCILDHIFDNNFYVINFEMIQHIVEYKNREFVPSLRTKNYSTLLMLNYVPLLKHVENNIGLYTDNIILSGTNTEEEIDAIVKLLELNVGSNCRHIQIIGNEHFYVDDITKICADMVEENKDYVRNIWNAIITNKKLKPTWKNFFNYWRYFGHTPESIAYMSVNAEALIMDDSSCIQDNKFIEGFIKSNINHESFVKLLSKLPWSDFNIKLNLLGENKVSTMISQRYFKFNVERYDELLEVFPALCIEFIIYNQSEYMSVRDEINMDTDLFETLIFDERFKRDYAQDLIEEYGEEYMTSKIACNLTRLKVHVNSTIFKIAWNLLDNNQKEQLMLQHLEILDIPMFEDCFLALSGTYHEFSDRNRRHDVLLENTDSNLKLAQRLKDLGYITSFQHKENKKFDPVKEKDVIIIWISCRVKSKS